MNEDRRATAEDVRELLNVAPVSKALATEIVQIVQVALQGENERLREILRNIGKRITKFDRLCAKGQGTDIDNAWGLFYDIRKDAYRAVRGVLKRKVVKRTVIVGSARGAVESTITEYTPKRILNALRTLCNYGRQTYRQGSQVGFGMAVGKALSACDMRGDQVLDAASEALEDQNHHLSAAIVLALKDGRNVTRNKRTVTIQLPEVFHA